MKARCFTNNCFKCIRFYKELSIEYDFLYECSTDIMIDMSSDEISSLSKEVYDVVKHEYNIHGPRLSQIKAEALGDSLARLYLFTMVRDKNITTDMIRSVMPIIRRASKRSMPAFGVCEIIDGKLPTSRMPKCWLNLVNENT